MQSDRSRARLQPRAWASSGLMLRDRLRRQSAFVRASSDLDPRVKQPPSAPYGHGLVIPPSPHPPHPPTKNAPWGPHEAFSGECGGSTGPTTPWFDRNSAHQSQLSHEPPDLLRSYPDASSLMVLPEPSSTGQYSSRPDPLAEVLVAWSRISLSLST
jgi:hypothetical protein